MCLLCIIGIQMFYWLLYKCLFKPEKKKVLMKQSPLGGNSGLCFDEAE